MGFLTKIPTVVKVYNSTVQMYIPEAVEIKGVSWTFEELKFHLLSKITSMKAFDLPTLYATTHTVS